LSWGSSTGASTYEYCISTSAETCTTWVSRGGSRNAPLSGLTPGTTYYWQVRARNSFGIVYANGSETAFWTFTTAP
jgi:hypothetical protein